MTVGKWEIHIRLHTWLALFALGVTLWLTISHFAVILEIAAIFAGAFLLNLILRPAVDRLAGWRIPRSFTVLALYLLLIGVFVLMGSLVFPLLTQEVSSLRQNGPALLQEASNRLASTPIARWLPPLNTLVADLTQRLDTLLFGLVATVAGVGQVALDLLVLFVLSYLFAIDPRPSYQWVSHWLAPEYRPHLEKIWDGIVKRLTRWVWAQAGVALYVAVVFSTGFSLLGVPYAVTIGMAGGVLEIVPYLGSVITLTLALLSAATVNLWLVFWVLVYYTIAVLIESNIVAPVLYGRAIGLRSAFVLVILVIGVKVGGVVGVFFAVPAAVILSSLAEEVRTTVTPEQR